ncbi:MAG: monovalent cation/H+ antiporter subunit D family protein [Candidatus Omnitrophica bacterium]|nr:monovalent cation/H+ antiporter subunit D family protein [Candidatus Omnitrophota bacterium]
MSIIPLFIAIPLGAAFLVSLFGRRIKILPDLLANLCTASLGILSLLSVGIVREHGMLVYKIGSWAPPVGISLVLDGLTCFMLVTVNIIAFFITLYSISYMARYTAKWKFYTLFLLMLAGMNGVIATGDIFNLYVFLEIAAIASYALVAFGIEHEELEASFKYAVMGTLASSFILLGIIFLYSYTSTLNMADMSNVLLAKGPGKIVGFVVPLFILGFGLKAAIMPFHAWLPDAHPSAPAPISAMLSGLLIKVLGIYALMRIFFNVLGVSQNTYFVLMILGVISMTLGAFLAIGQHDIKRMLAYSSVSQIGYIMLGIGIATPMAIAGALFHLFNHATFKSLLFLNSGAIEYSTGTRDLKKMGGLNSHMPVTGATSLIGSMSISGMPPLSGFWSKLIIILAAVQAEYYAMAAIAASVSIITLAYYLKLQKEAFFGTLGEGLEKVKEAPLTMKLAMIALAAICIAGGLLLLPQVFDLFINSAAKVLSAGNGYAKIVFGSIR